MKTYTDEQLKRTLFNLLNLHENTEHILDTEFLHLCWLVEETLMDTYSNYYEYLAATKHSVYRDAALCHATWQQRTIALAKTLGIEIV